MLAPRSRVRQHFPMLPSREGARVKRVALLLVIVGAGASAWISAGASASSAGTAADGKFGVGLKLGAVVLSSSIGAVNGPWLVWNKSSCSYQVASSHPATCREGFCEGGGGGG